MSDRTRLDMRCLLIQLLHDTKHVIVCLILYFMCLLPFKAAFMLPVLNSPGMNKEVLN